MRRLFAVAVAVTAALVTPSQAAPTAQEAYGASLSVHLETARGTYLLQLLASRPDAAGSPAQVRLRLMDPDGRAVRLMGAPESFSTTASTVHLRARVGGSPLRVRWLRQSSTAASVGSHEGDDTSLEGWSVWGESASARVTLGRLTCVTASGVLGRAVIYGTSAYGAALSRGFGPALRGARCGAARGGLLG